MYYFVLFFFHLSSSLLYPTISYSIISYHIISYSSVISSSLVEDYFHPFCDILSRAFARDPFHRMTYVITLDTRYSCALQHATSRTYCTTSHSILHNATRYTTPQSIARYTKQNNINNTTPHHVTPHHITSHHITQRHTTHYTTLHCNTSHINTTQHNTLIITLSPQP